MEGFAIIMFMAGLIVGLGWGEYRNASRSANRGRDTLNPHMGDGGEGGV